LICFVGVLIVFRALWWQSCFSLSDICCKNACHVNRFVTLLLLLLFLLRAWNVRLPEDDVR
jgi:hypothetical protein